MNTIASQSVIFTSTGTAPVTIDSVTLAGAGFTLSGASFPLTLSEGQSATIALQFLPLAVGQATGQLAVSSNSSTGSTEVISLSGTGTGAPATLNSLSCGSASFAGSGSDSCQVTLTSAAPSGGLSVNLSSNNPAVTLPPTLTVPANASSASFTAAVASVATARAATLTVSQGSATADFVLELQAAAAPALTLSTASIPFGNLQVNTSAAQSVTLTSTGTAPLTVNGASLAGAGFSFSGPSLPVTLSPGQALTLTVQFDPTATGAASGQLTVASDSSTNGTAVISLSGTGTSAPAALSLLSCSSGSMVGAGTDVCTATLTSAAPSGGLTVNLSSSNSAVKVPATLSVPSGAASAEFTAAVASVTTAQAATITASVNSMLTSYTIQLNATILALSLSPASVAFGNVVVNTPTTESVTLTSTGTAPVTITGATLAGAGFTASMPSFPLTLAPAQQVSLDVGFDPTAVGAATGQLTISSNASTNGTAVIGLTGTGAAVAVAVTPASASINAGATQQFTASVTGTTNTAVTWTATGPGCSGSSCGTISSAGLYTAPATVPSPATVTITATSVVSQAQSASSAVTILSTAGATYYLAPAAAGGSDSNNGTSPQTPWLTPNHSVNCGDVIMAASGNYAPGTFAFTFGKVTGSGHCFAFLKCASFDSCYVTSTSGSGNSGIFVSTSHWAVMGFEVTNINATSGEDSCFKATTLGTSTITDVGFIDDIANGCGTGGFISAPYYGGGAYGVDYFILIADIAYNAAQTSETCASGVSVWEPVNYDTQPGTHTYVAQYFGWDNVEPSVCAGTAATDGEGVIFDTFSQFGYTGQTALENSITIFNGSHGIEAWENADTPIYIENNTTYANSHGPGLNEAYCGEIDIASLGSTVGGSMQVSGNIAQTNSATGCGANPNYSYFAANVNSTDSVTNNIGYSASAYNAACQGTCTGFSFGPNNTFGTNPGYASAPTSTPPAPSCGNSSSVIACVAPMVADFVPKAAGMSTYGYQPPSSTPNSDPLFPQWLCQYANQLGGLVTMGCAAQ